MTRETKLGLVVGLAFIVLFAVIISEGGGSRAVTPAKFGAAEQNQLADSRGAYPADRPGVLRDPISRANTAAPATVPIAPPPERRTPGVSQDPQLAGLPVLPRQNTRQETRTGPTRPTPTEAVAINSNQRQIPPQAPPQSSPRPAAPATELTPPAALAMKSSTPSNEPLVPRPIDSERPALARQNPPPGAAAPSHAGSPAGEAENPAVAAARPSGPEIRPAAGLAAPSEAPSPNPTPALADARQPRPLPPGLANIERKLDELARRNSDLRKNAELPLADAPAKAAANRPSAEQLAAAPPPAQPSRARPTYEVQNGDSLFKIARKQYGTTRPSVINALYEANRHVLDGRHNLKVGQKIVVPVVDGLAPRSAEAAEMAVRDDPNTARLAGARPVGPPIIPPAVDRNARQLAHGTPVKPAGAGPTAAGSAEPRSAVQQPAVNDQAAAAARLAGKPPANAPVKPSAPKGKLAAERLPPAVATSAKPQSGTQPGAKSETPASGKPTAGNTGAADTRLASAADDGTLVRIPKPSQSPPARSAGARNGAKDQVGKPRTPAIDERLASAEPGAGAIRPVDAKPGDAVTRIADAAAGRLSPADASKSAAVKPLPVKAAKGSPDPTATDDSEKTDASKVVAARRETTKSDRAKPAAARRTYVVRRNDTLRRIAARELGDSGQADAIYRLNRDRMKTPHMLRPGMKLRLPPHDAQSGGDRGRESSASSGA